MINFDIVVSIAAFQVVAIAEHFFVYHLFCLFFILFLYYMYIWEAKLTPKHILWMLGYWAKKNDSDSD